MIRRKNISILMRFLSIFVLSLFLFCSCSSGGALSGKAYLEERGSSAIDIIGEAKYVYDMIMFTGANVDREDSIEDEEGNIYYKAIDGEIATFNFEDLNTHLTAYFSEDFINAISDKNIYANDKGEIYTCGNDAESGIDYIDYEIKKVEKKKILYKVTVFYNAAWNGKNPNIFELEQEAIGENWVFVDEKDFKWGKSPQ